MIIQFCDQPLFELCFCLVVVNLLHAELRVSRQFLGCVRHWVALDDLIG